MLTEMELLTAIRGNIRSSMFSLSIFQDVYYFMLEEMARRQQGGSSLPTTYASQLSYRLHPFLHTNSSLYHYRQSWSEYSKESLYV